MNPERKSTLEVALDAIIFFVIIALMALVFFVALNSVHKDLATKTTHSLIRIENEEISINGRNYYMYIDQSTGQKYFNYQGICPYIEKEN